MSGASAHLYVHLPFCAHRCGYCDFVTAVGREDQHGATSTRCSRSSSWSAALLAPRVETIFLGGGTPTFTEPARARAAARRAAGRGRGDGRGESGDGDARARPASVTKPCQSCVDRARRASSRALLAVLERRARPDDVRRAVHVLRDAGFDNISLDLIYGIPGQSPADLDADLAEALALEPEHLSCYELEAKPGTRFTHAHGAELERQAESMETYFERVVETLTGAGYRWYETANFCRSSERAGRDLRARHNLGYWLGRDYLGLGIGAVSTIEGLRRRNAPRLGRYLAALGRARRRRASSSRSTAKSAGASGCCSGCGWTSRWRSPGSSPRSTWTRWAARAAGPGCARRRGRAETLALTERGPVPRRRGHRRAPGVGFSWRTRLHRAPISASASGRS